MRCTWLTLGFIVLTAVSCGFPPLAALQDGSNATDAATANGTDAATSNGTDAGTDGAASDNGQPVLELLAGSIGGRGNANGSGAAARFNEPGGVAVDGAGNVYVVDTGNNTIRKITAAGVATTLAGNAGMTGGVDGPGTAASFDAPNGVAVDGAGNVYVADFGNDTIRKITAAGVVTTLAGVAGMAGSVDGTGAAARFHGPGGVAVDGAGNVYVADSDNDTIRKISADGAVTTLAGTAGVSGSTDGTGAAARFSFPNGVAVDGAGNVYVADTFNDTIRKISPAAVVTTVAGTAGMLGSTDGTGAAARFKSPIALAVDTAANLYVADFSNDTIRKVSPAAVVTTLAGAAGMSGSSDGGTAARFNDPGAVAVDGAGNVYVADTQNNTIRKVSSVGVVTTLAGAAFTTGSADGTGAAARFDGLRGVAVDGAGNAYVGDIGNNTIRMISPAGVVTTLAGTAGMPGSVDGAGAGARFNGPFGVGTDGAGNIYVADENNSTIRKVSPAGAVTTLAGVADMFGSADGPGAAALFNNPNGVAVDGAGNVYVADDGNDTIRKVSPAGVVTTVAGVAGMSGSADGGATARFNGPTGVAVDSAGNIYVADTENSTIRKVSPAGVVTTLAGAPGVSGSADGTGAAARFKNPSGVAVDSAGNVYVVDTGNSTIRKVTAAGATSTIAGVVGGATGIVLGATPDFVGPQGLAIVGDALVIVDANAVLLLRHVVR